MITYCIATHIYHVNGTKEVYGPAHDIYDFLASNKKIVYFIKHDLMGGVESEVLRKKVEKIGRFHNKNLLIRSFEQIWLNFLLGLKQRGKVYYIGIDPINSLSGVLLKLFRKTDKNVYFSVDYADKRFNNTFLNGIYHLIDKICLYNCDEAWSVSARIVKKRKEQGIADHKNKLLPNSPFFDKKLIKENKNIDLIIVSNLTKSLNIFPILEVIKIISQKEKSIRLNIIGAGPEEKHFKDVVAKKSMMKYVRFLGQMDHAKVLEEISKSFLGFALYTNENTWNTYGDSMKTREYVAYGIPVIMNDIPSTADDVREYNAGLVVHDINSKTISSFIEKCILDKEYYNSIRKNAISMAKDFDKKKLLKELLIDNK